MLRSLVIHLAKWIDLLFGIILQVARGFTRGAFEVKPFTDEKAHKDLRQVTISMIRPTEARRTNNPGKKVTLFPVKKWKGGGK